MKLSYKNLIRPRLAGTQSLQIISSYLTTRDLQKLPLAEEGYAQLAHKLNVPYAIQELATVNLSLESGKTLDPAFQLELARKMLRPDELNQIKTALRRTGTQAWTSPYQFRLLLSALMRLPSQGGTRSIFEHDSDVPSIGMALLSSVDSLAPELPKLETRGPSDPIALLMNLVRSSYAEADKELDLSSAKGYILNKLLAEPAIAQAFQLTYGFSPQTFQTALLAIWAYFGRRAGHSRGNKHLAVDFEYLMGQALVPKNVGDFLLDRYCIDLDRLPIDATGQPIDLGYLSLHPFGISRGKLICLDLNYAFARASRELWNLGVDASAQYEVSAYRADAGYHFEDYCREILDAVISIRARHRAVLCDRQVLERSAPLDFLYIEGDTAVAIECKSTQLPSRALYGTDPEELARAIDEKFVQGTPKSKQGFIQCANHIRTLLSDRRKFGIERVNHIIPCLIVLDEWLTFAPAFEHATLSAKELFAEFGNLVGEPIILHVGDLRLLAKLSKNLGLGVALRSIGEANLRPSVTIRNYIHKAWPVHPSDMADVPWPKDFLEFAQERLHGNYTPPPSKSCQTCGQSMYTMTTERQGPAWYCFQCSCFSQEVFTREDQELLSAHVTLLKQRYRSGEV